MTLAAAPGSAIATRPYDAETERAYVWSTARAQTAARLGGRLVHYPSVIQHVDPILEACVIVVATFEDAPQRILGYVAWGTDGAVEFLMLNKALSEFGRQAPGQEAPAPAPGALQPRARLHARKLALNVLGALFNGERSPVMRRLSSAWVMEALQGAGINPSIVPRGV